MVYRTSGRSLTENERDILVNLIEECGEVVRAACKLLRFGVGDFPPGHHVSNSEHLGLEIGNMQAMVALAERSELVRSHDVSQGYVQKIAQLERLRAERPTRIA